MKVLTFLGTGKYDLCRYQWMGQECDTCFAPIASCQFLQADEMVVFLTDQAHQSVFPSFQRELPAGVQLSPVFIPLGRSEPELWQIFAAVLSQVQPREEVAFDVTHGLRSSPILSILAAAFLRSGFDVGLRAVFYGAYDARCEEGGVKHVPMFDLTPLITLLEWSAAADRFNRTGDSRYLASLVRQQETALAQAAGNDRARLAEVGQLRKLAKSLAGISQSLHLIRPEESMRNIASLERAVEQARPALGRSIAALPFTSLLRSVLDTYAPLAQEHPEDPARVWETLRVERRMIAWYVDRELWVQAASLAREWLVSWVMACRGNLQVNQLNARKTTETILGSESDEFIIAKKAGRSYQPAYLAGIPQIDTVLALWPTLAEVRNDIDHAGKREQPRGPETLIKQIKQIVQHIETLPLEI